MPAYKGSCPKHGSKYMTKEGASWYCAAPTPDEISSKCFYHPHKSHPKENKFLAKKRAEEAKGTKPDVFAAIIGEWDRHKKNRREQLERQRAGAEERKAEREAKKNSLIFIK